MVDEQDRSAEDAYRDAEGQIAKAREKGSEGLFLGIPALTTLPPGIETLTKLRHLDLYGAEITDLTPLANCTQLTNLDLRNTPTADLAPISGLSGLQRLYLNSTQVADLAPISGLSGLQTLDLDNTQVADLAPISGLSGLQMLYLDSTQVADLAPISGLSGLQMLYLNSTQVADLAPISGLSGLQVLYIRNCPARDLRPLKTLKALAEDRREDANFFYNPGLWFEGCAATEADPELARLSEIEDDRQRTVETLAYLQGLGEDEEPSQDDAPKQSGVFNVATSATKGFDAEAALPSVEERGDRVKRLSHEKLLEAVKEYCWLTGNQHALLNRRARSLEKLVDRPFEDLDLLSIHLDLEAVRQPYDTRAERTGDHALSSDLVEVMADILRLGPALVRDNADVELFEERQRKERGYQPDPEVEAARDDLLIAIAGNVGLIGETLREVAQLTHDLKDLPRGKAAGVEVSNNTVIAVSTVLGLAVTTSVEGIIGNRADALVTWAFENAHLIRTVAEAYGESMVAWVSPLLKGLQESGGASMEAYRAAMARIRRD